MEGVGVGGECPHAFRPLFWVVGQLRRGSDRHPTSVPIHVTIPRPYRFTRRTRRARDPRTAVRSRLSEPAASTTSTGPPIRSSRRPEIEPPRPAYGDAHRVDGDDFADGRTRPLFVPREAALGPSPSVGGEPPPSTCRLRRLGPRSDGRPRVDDGGLEPGGKLRGGAGAPSRRAIVVGPRASFQLPPETYPQPPKTGHGQRSPARDTTVRVTADGPSRKRHTSTVHSVTVTVVQRPGREREPAPGR